MKWRETRMEDIINHLGEGLLAIVVSVLAIGFYLECIEPGGAIYTAAVQFMQSICG